MLGDGRLRRGERPKRTGRKVILTSEFRAHEIARARRSDPGSLLVNLYGAELKNGCYSHHISRQYVLSDGRQVSVTFKKETGMYVWVIEHDRSQGGCGTIDLVVSLDGCSLKAAIFKLCPSLDPTGSPSQRRADAPTAITIAMDARLDHKIEPAAASAPLASPRRWHGVRKWLTTTRGLPGKLVDHLHLRDLVFADERCNAVFRRLHGGAFLRGTTSSPFFRAVGSKACGPFVVPGDRHVVLVESPIDALSVKGMAPRCHVIALRGAMLNARDVLNDVPPDRPVVLAFDNDERGLAFTAASLLVWPSAKVRTPDGKEKDWNDVIRSMPSKIHSDWA